ncbi:hypothetical protein C8R43DRAFT_87079 [Mycena crocata]|nr:hypothetical protein C8R43DRAFT_87079 [Mycena crocata]
MPAIPQELMDGILSELDDSHSLKACSVAASKFRVYSQRSLFRSLTLAGKRISPDPPTMPMQMSQRDFSRANPRCFGATSAFLRGSPHIAPYVKRLTIVLDQHDWDLENFQKALAELTHVRICEVDGHNRSIYDRFPPALASVLLDFFARQPLCTLSFQRLGRIPLPLLLGPAPSLKFYAISVAKDAPASPPVQRFNLEQLVLDYHSDELYDLLSRPSFMRCIAPLRRLSLDPQYANCSTVISTAAGTLEHLHFNCTSADGRTTTPLPPLPALRIVEFKLLWPHVSIAPYLSTLSAYLLASTAASPALTEILLTYAYMSHSDPLHIPPPNSLSALDKALTAHLGAPLIRWRIASRFDVAEIGAFKDSVRAGMPVAQAKGQLVFEEHDDDKKYAADNWRFDFEQRRG